MSDKECKFYSELIEFGKPYGQVGTAKGCGFCTFNLPDVKFVNPHFYKIPRCNNLPDCPFKTLQSENDTLKKRVEGLEELANEMLELIYDEYEACTGDRLNMKLQALKESEDKE